MTPVVQRTTAIRYGTAVAAVVLVLVLKFLFAPLAQTPYPLFLAAILFGSWFGGIGPGLLATLCSTLAVDYFFLDPLFNLSFDEWVRSPRLMQFEFEGVFVAVLSGLRRRYLHLLHRRIEELRIILNSIADAVITTDAKGVVDFLNPVAEGLTGWTSNEAAGRPLTDVLRLINEDGHGKVDPPVGEVIRTGQAASLAGRTLQVARGGTRRPVVGSAAPIMATDGRLLGVVLALHDVTQHRLAEELLRAGLLSRLATIQEDERRRIARELHDETGQQLTALTLGLKSLRGRPDAGSLAGDLASLQELAELIGHSAHHVAWQLRPTALDDLGLEKALRDWFEHWSDRSGVPIAFHCTLGPHRLNPEFETHLYRIICEALTNVRRHAMALHVSVILERRPDHIQAIIEDDGLGFDPDAVRRSASAKHKLGLFGIEERAGLMSGTLRIESSPGQGTTVFVRVPLTNSEDTVDEKDSRLVG